MDLAKCIRFTRARATQLNFRQFPRFQRFWLPTCQSPGGGSLACPIMDLAECMRFPMAKAQRNNISAICRISRILEAKTQKTRGVILASPIMGLAECRISHSQGPKIQKIGNFQDFQDSGGQNTKVHGGAIMGLAKCIRFPIAITTQLEFWQFPRSARFFLPKCRSPGDVILAFPIMVLANCIGFPIARAQNMQNSAIPGCPGFWGPKHQSPGSPVSPGGVSPLCRFQAKIQQKLQIAKN